MLALCPLFKTVNKYYHLHTHKDTDLVHRRIRCLFGSLALQSGI